MQKKFQQHRACVATTVGVLLAVAAASAPARAQSRDSLYRRAQGMVSNGDAAAGRALVDSLLNAAPEGSPQYAQGLYWRATLAASGADAAHDYQRIVVDYPRSPWADDALLRLGELELMRGDYDAALLHLQRLTRDHPTTPLRAKASYWTARAFFNKGDAVAACAANDDALAHAVKSDVELKNQINYQRQRCQTLAVQPQPPTLPAPAGSSPPAANGVASTPPQTPPPPPAAAAPPSATPRSASRSTSKHGRQSSPQTAHHHAGRKSTSATPTEPLPSSTGKASGDFAVQVAAYYDRSQADGSAAKLRKRGYPAHVDGSTAPFRVRIGHYATHAAAAAQLVKLKAKQIDGFVTQE